MLESRLPKKLQRLLIAAFILGLLNSVTPPLLSQVWLQQIASDSSTASNVSTILVALTTTFTLLYRACFGSIVYFDARSRNQPTLLWTLIAVVFQIEGVILYFVYCLIENREAPKPAPPPLHWPDSGPTASTPR